MDPKEKAKLLDKLLVIIKERKSITWFVMTKPEFLNALSVDKETLGQLVANLIADGMVFRTAVLDEEASYVANEDVTEYLTTLSPRGFAVASDLKHLGYVKKEAEYNRIEGREEKTLFYAKSSFWVAIVSAVIAIIALLGVNKCSQGNTEPPNKSASSTINQV